MKQISEIFLDTNILVHASLVDFDKQKHKEAVKAIEALYNNKAKMYISTQVIREFYAVVTNKKYLKKPLSIENAIAQINFFKNSFITLLIDMDVITELQQLLSKYKIKGQKIHDLTIVATMTTSQISHILTYNEKDFKNFKEIKVVVPTK